MVFPTSTSAPLEQLRPNGSQAACDPCRARKVACDHVRPACSRCQSKNRTTECIYSNTATRKSRATEDDVRLNHSGHCATEILPRPSKRPRTYKRLGCTSSLEETQLNLLPEVLNSPSYQSQQASHIIPGRKIIFDQLPPTIRETCLLVLRALPGQQNEQMVYLDGRFTPRGWVHLAVHRIINWLQIVFADTSRGEQEILQHVAQVISTNTSKPLRGPYPDWESWLSCFVGENTRWESIGLLWTHMECVSDMLDALIPRRLVRSRNNTSGSTAQTHLERCIHLTRHFTEDSDLLADLYRRKSTLESIVTGELGEADYFLG